MFEPEYSPFLMLAPMARFQMPEQTTPTSTPNSICAIMTVGPAEDFHWVDNDEPHASRRREILKKYPEIQKLFGPDIRLLPGVLGLVCLQLVSAVLLRDASWPAYLFFAWVLGGTISHSLSLANHELSHGLCFESFLPNEILGMIANIAQALPSSITFKRYHLEHHQKQGYDQFDVDVPTNIEGKIFRGVLGKFFFIFCQPFFYALRPVMVYPKPLVFKEVVNAVLVFGFDYFFYQAYGWNALAYLLLSDWLGLGLHPISGHFISEHYEFVRGQETYSYYGPLNYLTWNVGYHNEHHDFPRISGFNLPKVREIAKEFYVDLAQTKSWPGTLYDFITNPEITPFSRVKRFPKDGQAHAEAQGASSNQTSSESVADSAPQVAAVAEQPLRRNPKRTSKAE